MCYIPHRHSLSLFHLININTVGTVQTKLIDSPLTSHKVVWLFKYQ